MMTDRSAGSQRRTISRSHWWTREAGQTTSVAPEPTTRLPSETPDRCWLKRYRYRGVEAPHGIAIKLSQYQLTTGRFIFNVIPGYRGKFIDSISYIATSIICCRSKSVVLAYITNRDQTCTTMRLSFEITSLSAQLSVSSWSRFMNRRRLCQLTAAILTSD